MPKNPNTRLPSEHEGGKPYHDADFAAGFKAGQQAFTKDPTISAVDAHFAYRKVSGKHGSWWKTGFTAAIDHARGASGPSGVVTAGRLGLIERLPTRKTPTRASSNPRATANTAIWDLAEQFGLEPYDEVHDRNWEVISDAGSAAWNEVLRESPRAEARAEKARVNAGRKADESMYHAWHSAVLSTVEPLLEEHGLRLAPIDRSKRVRDYPALFRLVPALSWEDSARKLIRTINGVGEFEFSSLREFMDSGPYTAREAVLSHLGWIQKWPEVYGEKSTKRRFESSLDQGFRNL